MAPSLWGVHGLVLLLQLVAVKKGNSSGAEQDQDWSQCPPACHCTWVGGKRSADCQGGGFASLPQFRHADQIQVVDLHGNPLLRLTETAFNQSHLINLQKVYLQNCSLATIHPTAFTNLVLMIELDLSHNNIRSLLPATFQGNIRIRKLWLHHNPLRSLQDFSFPSIPHLRSLDLSHCLLRRVGLDTFRHINLLEVLSLEDNQFHRLDPAAFRALANLKSLKLSHNPWHCDCRLDAFWHWVMAKNLFNAPTLCLTPKKLAGVSWDGVEQADLACPPRLTVRQPERSVTLGSTVHLSCFIGGAHRRASWVRSGFVVKNNSVSLDGGTQNYILRARKVTNRRMWYNLTIGHVDRSGSGVYSCVAENEGGLAESNATIVITDSSTYLGRKELSLVWVAAASFMGVALALLGAMTFYAARERRRRHSLLTAQPQGTLKPADSALIFSRALDLRSREASCAKGDYDSPLVTDLLERDHCNSSNSNNSAYSGDDSGVGSSSSNIVRLEHSGHRPMGCQNSKVHFPDLVKVPISEEDHGEEAYPSPPLYTYQRPSYSDWASTDSTTSLMRAEAEPPSTPRQLSVAQESSLPRHLPSSIPCWPSRSPSMRLKDTSLPRQGSTCWRDMPTSLTDSDFALMKQELAARKLTQRPGGRQAFLLARIPSSSSSSNPSNPSNPSNHTNPNNPRDDIMDSRSQLLHALVQDHNDTVV